MRAFKSSDTIALIGKYNAQGIEDPLRAIATTLIDRGHKVLLDIDTAQRNPLPGLTGCSLTEIGQEAQLAVVVGGDGTMLGIARHLTPYDVPLVGINLGRLGFMTDIPLIHATSALTAILEGAYQTEQRTMLSGQVIRNDTLIFNALALNDVVVSRGAYGGMIEISVRVDNQPMTTQRADGLIVATPTGSTAYALSAGGPILHPQLGGFILMPVAPHALTNRPIALPDSCKIEIQIHGPRMATAHFDMQSLVEVRENDLIVVQRANHTVHLLHPQGYNYFAMLRQKLHWNTSPSLDILK